MPGVPSYRGCDACRRQKKKCNQAQPACSRCARLKIRCIGVGKQRFTFKEESPALAISKARTRARGNVSNSESVLFCPRTPSNDTTLLERMSITLLEVTHPGYDVHCYGPVMKELPRRLGHHAALDAAVVAFTAAITSIPAETVSSECLRKYIMALNTLQKTLDVPSTAYTPDTLCAIYLLTICQGWMAKKGDKAPTHGRGMLHLMNRLVSQKSDDEFMVKAILSVTGALVYESIFNTDIELDPWIWTVCAVYKPKHLPKRGTGDNNCAGAGYVFQSCEFETLAVVSNLMRNPKANIGQINSIYTMVSNEYTELRRFGDAVIAPIGTKPLTSIDAIRAQTSYHQAQSIMLTICLAFNAFLRDSHLATPMLDSERVTFCEDAVILAEDGRLGRPLAAVHIPLSTAAAWLVSTDNAQRERLRVLLEDYQGNFSMFYFINMVSHWDIAPKELRELAWFPCDGNGLGDLEPKMSEGRQKGSTSTSDAYQNCCIL